MEGAMDKEVESKQKRQEPTNGRERAVGKKVLSLAGAGLEEARITGDSKVWAVKARSRIARAKRKGGLRRDQNATVWTGAT
jgi:hypothetical protein